MLRTTSPHAASVVSTASLTPLHDRAQRPLGHEVELHPLAGREPHRAVGEVGEAVLGQPLLGGQAPARHRRPHHARVRERKLLRGAGATDVAIVLLVDPVELEQRHAVGLERVGGGGQLARQVAAQLPAGPLDVLDAHDAPPPLMLTGTSAPLTWSPHSFLSLPAQRPERGSSPSATGRVHGQQPIDG